MFHEWYVLDLWDHPCVISQPWQPVKDTNNMANSKLQMVIDCLDVLGDSMPLEVTFVYSPNFRKCWKCIKECWPIDEFFCDQTETLEKVTNFNVIQYFVKQFKLELFLKNMPHGLLLTLNMCIKNLLFGFNFFQNWHKQKNNQCILKWLCFCARNTLGKTLVTFNKTAE